MRCSRARKLLTECTKRRSVRRHGNSADPTDGPVAVLAKDCRHTGADTAPRHREFTMIELRLRRTLSAVALSGATLALTLAAATPAQAATTGKVRADAIQGGN